MSSPTDLLRAVWGDGFHTLCAGRGKNESFYADGCFDDVDALLDRAFELTAQGLNVWFGFHPMTAYVEPPARGGADMIGKVWAIPVDIDWHDPDAHAETDLPSEADVRAKIDAFLPRPTVCLCSGHGIQAWWVLDAPVDAATGADLILRMHAELQRAGLPTDRADLASVVRVPGSMNYKTSTPVEVTVIFENLKHRHTAEYLAKRLGATTGGTGSGRTGTASKGTWVRGLEATAAKLRELDREQDAEALEVACNETYKGHHPWMDRNGSVYVTRPGKKGGTSVSVGHGAPGELYVFTPSWKPLKKHQRYVVNDAGDALEMANDVFGASVADDGPTGTTTASTGTTSRADGVPASWSDAHVGEAFGETLSGRWLYCRPLGGWFRWDGRRWALDPGEAVHEEFRQWIIELGDRLWKQTGDGDTMKQVARYRDTGKINAAVTIARRLETVAADASEFDRHAHLLNVQNGIVDLRSGSLLSHDPTLRMTKLAGADYVPDATHPDVTKVLESLNDDVRPWVQRLFGSSASGEVLDDVLAVFDGTGSNSKTTILKAASVALGDYAAPASTRLLMAKAATDEHPTLFADLLGRRLIYIEETPEGGALKMEQVKNITGGGAIKARFIGGNYFHFEPSHTIIVATNHRPAVSASDHAAWRRLRLVPFTKTYRLPHEAKPGDLIADRGLRGRLSLPAQRTAMLAWIVAGAVAWYAEGGFGSCPTVDQATSRWRREEDVIHGWWNDRINPTGMVGAAELYRSFVSWCEQEGRRYISSNKEFAKRFGDHELYVKHGIRKRDTRSGAVYEGLCVVDVVGVPPGLSRSAVGEPTPPPTTSTTTRGDASEWEPW